LYVASEAVPFYEIETGQIINVNIDASKISPFKTYALTLDDADGSALTALHVREVIPQSSPHRQATEVEEAPFEQIRHYYRSPETETPRSERSELIREPATEESPESLSGSYSHYDASRHASNPVPSTERLEEEEAAANDAFSINQFGGFGTDPVSLLALQAAAFGGGEGGGHGHGGPGGKKGDGYGGGASPTLVVSQPYAMPVPYPYVQQKQQQLPQTIVMPVQTMKKPQTQPIQMNVQMPQPVIDQTYVQPTMTYKKQQNTPIYQTPTVMPAVTTINTKTQGF